MPSIGGLSVDLILDRGQTQHDLFSTSQALLSTHDAHHAPRSPQLTTVHADDVSIDRMSLHVTHLNGDASFLLHFSPPCASSTSKPNSTPSPSFPGSFTILLDPWITPSPSYIYSKHFALTQRNVPACIESLADIPDPDLVICSQDKPDHCHRDTLLKLPRNTGATVLGNACAARKILSWNHFSPDAVHSLPAYDAKTNNVFRIPIPPFSPLGEPGEVTVALLQTRKDLTGLHNAVAITYRPPSTPLSSPASTAYVTLPPTPPTTPPALSISSASSSASSTTSLPRISFPLSGVHTREKAISLLFSPHGVHSYDLVHTYATKHLMPQLALPLTALIHSFSRSSNPWFLGGNITAGCPGGVEIARNLGAKVWIGAHDEDKTNSGISVKGLKVEKFDVECVRRLLAEGGVVGSEKPAVGRGGACRTEIVELASGEEYFIPASGAAKAITLSPISTGARRQQNSITASKSRSGTEGCEVIACRRGLQQQTHLTDLSEWDDLYQHDFAMLNWPRANRACLPEGHCCKRPCFDGHTVLELSRQDSRDSTRLMAYDLRKDENHA
ncbi:hypothetical protein MRB53_040471 [Persea americana]|nr:hypothetical protein MRB53_040471 [Persea americana]